MCGQSPWVHGRSDSSCFGWSFRDSEMKSWERTLLPFSRFLSGTCKLPFSYRGCEAGVGVLVGSPIPPRAADPRTNNNSRLHTQSPCLPDLERCPPAPRRLDFPTWLTVHIDDAFCYFLLSQKQHQSPVAKTKNSWAGWGVRRRTFYLEASLCDRGGWETN